MTDEKRPVGAPRTVSLPPEDFIKLGEEMLNWVENNHPLHLSEWYTIEKMFTYKQWKTFILKEEFIPYYERAIKFVAKNCLNGGLDKSIAQRFLGLYFNDVREYDEGKVEHEARVKAKEIKNVSENIEQKLTEHMNFMTKSQDERKSERSLNSDKKSE